MDHGQEKPQSYITTTIIQASRQECIIENYFSYFSTKRYVVATEKNRLIDD